MDLSWAQIYDLIFTGLETVGAAAVAATFIKQKAEKLRWLTPVMRLLHMFAMNFGEAKNNPYKK